MDTPTEAQRHAHSSWQIAAVMGAILALLIPTIAAAEAVPPTGGPNDGDGVEVANATPIGFHDGNEGTVPTYDCAAFGWAVDPDDRGARLLVRILVDGVETTSGVADALREDLIASGDSPDGLAGFSFDLRDLVAPVVVHEITAQARDDETGEWSDLEATPRTMRCFDDPSDNPFVGAWTSTDIDGSTERITVSSGPAALRVSYADDFASVCAEGGATVTVFHADGHARRLGPDVLEVNLDDGRCGAHVVPIDWPIYFDYLVGTDQLLTDGTRIWSRHAAETPDPGLPA